MKRQALEHLLRAAGKVLGETHFIVIGSQSILGKYPDAPDRLLMSVEADLIAKHKPTQTDLLNVIGEMSPFHETHGYYADPVSEQTAVLPRGWKGRLVNLSSPMTEGVTGLCLDPHDLFVAKVAANREKDIDFVKVMIEHALVDKDSVLKLAATVPAAENDPDRAKRIVRRIKGLYANVEEAKRK